MFACLSGLPSINSLAQPVLKDVFKGDFLIGAALNRSQFTESNSAEAALIKHQFNTISPENDLKWEFTQPLPGKFDFSAADRYVEFGLSNNMFVIGHNLVWHSQTPKWVFQDDQGNPVTRDTLLQRMHDHIRAVVGRYKGKIRGWDVVNEALNGKGELRASPWRTIIGEDYVEKAFQFAHEADPGAELYYNDYALEDPSKRNGAIELVHKLRSHNVQVSGVGMQGHYRLDLPTTNQVDETIEAFARQGLKVMITELDVDVLPSANYSRDAEVSMHAGPRPELNPYPNGLPEVLQQRLAQRYADLFSVFEKHRGEISRVTFWGVTDRNSWLNDWPVPGRTSYPLLFDRDCHPKPALDAAVNAAGKAKQAS
jgi:endo-1,4-beta-xylanase